MCVENEGTTGAHSQFTAIAEKRTHAIAAAVFTLSDYTAKSDKGG